MKIAIIGSRSFSNYELFCETINNYLIENDLTVKCVVSGGAKGADALSEKFAIDNGLEMMVFRPDWKKYGRTAGIIRNTQIIENSDIVFAFWDGKSSGTKDSVAKAEKLGKKVITILFSEE